MEIFNLKNQVEKVIRGDNTNFLTLNEQQYIINSLKKENKKYKIFKPFEEAEKSIIYKDKLNISLYQIITTNKLSHPEILGSLFSHNLKENYFGDIIIDENYYILVLNDIENYLENNFVKIGNKNIKLIKRELEEVRNYKLSYKEININVSSLRIDNIISKIIPTSRSNVNNLLNDQRIIMNYEVLKNKNYMVKENDIFSIRRIGKFKFICINKINKSGKYNILIKKYS